MAYRDDADAMLERLHALEVRVAVHHDVVAARDTTIAALRDRVAELETEVARMSRDLLDREATIRDLQRIRGVSVSPPRDAIAATAQSPQEAAARYLAEGLDRYRRGDRSGAVAAFQKGLAQVPDHAELQRALRRYS